MNILIFIRNIFSADYFDDGLYTWEYTYNQKRDFEIAQKAKKELTLGKKAVYYDLRIYIIEKFLKATKQKMRNIERTISEINNRITWFETEEQKAKNIAEKNKLENERYDLMAGEDEQQRNLIRKNSELQGILDKINEL